MIDLKNKEFAEQQNDKKRGETAVDVLQKEKASKERELKKIERGLVIVMITSVG